MSLSWLLSQSQKKNTKNSILNLAFFRGFFLRITQYNEDAHNTHAHSHPMNTRTQTLPLWAPPKDWAPANLKIPKSPLALRRRRERRLPLNV